MTPSGAEAERKRAARAGRRMLARALPPGISGWIDRLAGSHDTPDEVYAWVGALAAIATGLEQAFLTSGTEVRDQILGLHSMLFSSETGRETEGAEAFEPFLPWLKARLEGSTGSPPVRVVLMQWIDVASERLTLRRYHRPDLPAHHAHTLIVLPAETIGIDLTPGGALESSRGEHPPTHASEIALAVLRFVDLLDAERLAAQGKKRISAPDSEEFGGFYGISESVQPPTQFELQSELKSLRDRTTELLEKPGLPSALQAILEDMRRALEERERHGQWPEAFRWRSPAERRRPTPLLKRLFGSR